MDRERLGRALSAALVPLGFVLLVLGVAIGEPIGAALGAITAILGAAFFWAVDRFSDETFDLTEPSSLTANLVQLGGVLTVFALLTYVVGDPERVTRAFYTDLPSPSYPAYAGVSMGVVLGGGVAYLMHRLPAFGEAVSESVPARTIGFFLTFGTYVILLIVQPPSGALCRRVSPQSDRRSRRDVRSVAALIGVDPT